MTATVTIIDNTYADFNQALAPVDHAGVPMIDARSLHKWLGVGRAFAGWLQGRAKEYGFEMGTDFLLSQTGKQKGRGGSNRKEYLLTLDTAKELAMVEKTELGRATRRYFIDMEAGALKMAADHIKHGTPERIASEVFDAPAALAALKAELVAYVDETLSPKKSRIDTLPEWMTAGAVVDHFELVNPRVPASARHEVHKTIGRELTSVCLLGPFKMERRGGGTTATERNVYPRDAVVAWAARQEPDYTPKFGRFHGCR